jgi:hypothetical protein
LYQGTASAVPQTHPKCFLKINPRGEAANEGFGNMEQKDPGRDEPLPRLHKRGLEQSVFGDLGECHGLLS